MTTDAAQAQALRDWSRRLRGSGARGCLFLAGPAAWAERLIDALADERGTTPTAVPPDTRIDTVLGQEATLVHHQAREALDVDLLAAVAGTVAAGGILVVTVPDLADWHSANDRAVERYLSHGYGGEDYGDRFLDRLRRLLADRPEIWLLTPNAVPQPPPAAAPSPPSQQPNEPDCATADQAEAVRAVERLAQGRARRPLVISADRGRGKSTALGIGAERLLAAHPECRILVTGPQRASAVRLLERVDVRYIPPDELLRHHYEADVLIVDEAAGIPIPILLGLVRRFPRVAFATTVHGYEGTGRGFALRFDDHLRAADQNPRHVTLHEPIRWRADDPLEAFLAEDLLLNAEPVDDPGEAAQSRRLDRDELAGDEAKLRATFGLLVGAHYRTRPTDLRQLLDAPEVGVHATLDTAGQPVGVALTADEGPLPDELQEPIWLGARRVRGHLTPQSLAVHAGDRTAPALAYRRILRIAVHPARRRIGIGSGLIQAITDAARAEGMDAVAASFGATAALMPFWRANGLDPVRLGHRRDRASGTHAAIVLAPITEPAAELRDQLRHEFQDQLAHHLPGAFSDLETELVEALARGLPAPALSERDWWQIAAFAVGRRNRLDALPALVRLTWTALSQNVEATNEPLDGLIMAILQQRDESTTAHRLGLPGQRQCLAQLRSVVYFQCQGMGPRSVQAYIASEKGG
jgi:tRNA(Met) cytidine acetyltransferase